MDAIFSAADITSLSTNISALIISLVGVSLLFVAYRYVRRSLGDDDSMFYYEITGERQTAASIDDPYDPNGGRTYEEFLHEDHPDDYRESKMRDIGAL